MLADGTNGSVEFVDQSIVIRRKGLANIVTQGMQGDKTILLRSITAIQFRPAGAFMAGLIQFTIIGGREFRGGMLEATKDENAVMFTREQEPAFELLRDIVQDCIRQSHRLASSVGAVDELERFAALMEKGHLSPGEFADIKQRLLKSSESVSANPQSPMTYVDDDESPKYKARSVGCFKQALVIFAIFLFFCVMPSAFSA